MMDINYIMERYRSGELSLDGANAELAAMGAGFHIEAGKDGAWTKEEMESGFVAGAARPVGLKKPDLRRRPDLAGQTVTQRTQAGVFTVTYDENGYAASARNTGWNPPAEEDDA